MILFYAPETVAGLSTADAIWAAAPAAAASAVSLRPWRAPGPRRLALWLICFALSSAAAVALDTAGSASAGAREGGRSGPFTGLPPQTVTLVSGTVAADLEPSGGGESFSLSLGEVRSAGGSAAGASGRLAVYTSHESVPLMSGRRVEVPVTLRRSAEGTDPRLFARASAPAVRKGWSSAAKRLRARGLLFVHRRLRSVGPPASGLLSALLLGIRGPENDRLFALFRRSGAVHLLALSGMHLGFLFLIIAGLFVPLLGKKTGLTATLAGMVLYLLFVGPRPSLLRAVLMSGMGILWTLWSPRRIDTLRLLTLAAVIQMAWMPADAYSLSFGLSYLALFGILGFSGAVERRLPFFIPPAIRTLTAAGISAQAVSAPLLLAVFGEVHPGGVLSSVLLAPAVLLFMGTGVAYLLWSAGASALAGSLYVRADLLFRLSLRTAAELIERAAAELARIPSVRVTGEGGGRAAAVWILVLTLIVLLHYGRIIAAVHRREDEAHTKPRFSRGDTGLPAGDGSGPIAPIWAELPDKSGRQTENHRAA